MTNPSPTIWRFLIIEDNPELARQLKEACAHFVPEGSSAVGETYVSFELARPVLDSAQFDLVILDLKDQASDHLSGEDLFRQIKQRRFIPVVFYTGLPNAIQVQQTAFLRIVEKTKGITELRKEILAIFQTGLPGFVRHLENEQRTYMWDVISTNWPEITADHQKIDLVYLLARRLARSMQRDAVRKFIDNGSALRAEPQPAAAPEQVAEAGGAESQNTDEVHPIELYIHPSDTDNRFACDIVKETANGQHWMILTPSCDFEQNNAEHVLLAKCEGLEVRKEYTKWAGKLDKPDTNITDKFTRLVQDRQVERFKFLPSTFFLPNLLVDFQQLRSVPIGDMANFTPVASLDSPFAEATLARFARYFGRLGTPNLDANMVLNRLTEVLKKDKAREPKATLPSTVIPSTPSAAEQDKQKNEAQPATSKEAATGEKSSLSVISPTIPKQESMSSPQPSAGV